VGGVVVTCFRAHEAERRTSWLKDWIEEGAETAGEFNKVAGVAEPCCAQFWCFASGEEGWLADGDGRRGCVWGIGLAAYLSSGRAMRSVLFGLHLSIGEHTRS